MAITMMCDKTAEGAELSEHRTRSTGHEIWIRTTHHGLVLYCGEMSYHDDSDFYALVWNDETNAPERIEYASTRGWTYPNNAVVDATSEVVAKYKAWEAERQQRERARRDALEAATPRKGKRVVVRKGRKIPIGTEGDVFWCGQYEYGPLGHLRAGRVGIFVPGTGRVFTNVMNVEVVR